MAEREPLSFPEFQSLLADWLSVDVERLRPDTHFIDDLELDSLRLVGLLLRTEALGVQLSPDLAWQLQTVGDAYRLASQQQGKP